MARSNEDHVAQDDFERAREEGYVYPYWLDEIPDDLDDVEQVELHKHLNSVRTQHGLEPLPPMAKMVHDTDRGAYVVDGWPDRSNEMLQ